MRPKADGAWHLHELTREAALDFFVLFASGARPARLAWPRQLRGRQRPPRHARASSPRPRADRVEHRLGTVGQSRHGRARQLTRSRALGQPGPRPIDPARGLDALRTVIQRDRAQMIVLPIDWPTFARRFKASSLPSFVADLVSAATRPGTAPTGSVPQDDLLLRLVACEPEGRPSLARTYVAAQLESVLGLHVAETDHQQPITAWGLDSLMAVELKNRFEAELGVLVPVVDLLKGPTVGELAGMIVAGISAGHSDDAPAPIPVAIEEGEF